MWLALAAPLPLFLWTGVHGGMRQRDELVRTEGLWALRILIAGFALSPLARRLRAPGPGCGGAEMHRVAAAASLK